ncbi:ABC transporter substrate-binding protein [Virgisporangium aurantiacum]|uniref:Branched-chain amino acid ABC transporter substrate-binding protein n=1 Tax=Virgisporangium aurantiacum TaxID=175570 RepID=A0A8J3ZFM8_9ACTN|nr:ABC transporter substrate-binding protein [Virgisporangium aurantiacum]GIJ63274.1 branched-chain amino acid ABC transporter substrate-binding protein [Virgisporangium aurantiacum]
MGQFRKIGVVATVAVLAVAAGACAEDDNGGGTDTGGPIRIGAILDITGAGASLGVPERKTLELLTKKANDAGGIGNRKIELTIEDDQSTEDGAAKAMNELVSKNVDIIIGASRTGTSLAMRPIAESAKMPMISMAANVKVTDGATWVFKTAQNDAAVLANVVDYAKTKGWKKIGLVRDSSAFGEGVAELLNELGKADGISVVVTEKFAPDATEFTAQMLNIRNAKADMNLIWGIPPAAALAQKAYKQLGITAPVMQSHGIGNQVFLDTAGPAADGLVAPVGRLVVADQLPASDPQKAVLTKFVADYKAAYNETPSTFAGHAWDAFQLAADAFKAVGTDKQKVRDKLEQVKGFVGITGIYMMTAKDHSGLGKDALVLVTVQNSKWALAPK